MANVISLIGFVDWCPELVKLGKEPLKLHFNVEPR